MYVVRFVGTKSLFLLYVEVFFYFTCPYFVQFVKGGLYCTLFIHVVMLRGYPRMVTVMGGESDKDDLYIAPTLITDVKNVDAIMEDEVRDMHMYTLYVSYTYVVIMLRCPC